MGGWDGLGLQFFPTVFGYSKAFLVLRVFILLNCTSSSPLAKEKRLFLELSLTIVVGLSGLLTSPATHLGYIR